MNDKSKLRQIRNCDYINSDLVGEQEKWLINNHYTRRWHFLQGFGYIVLFNIGDKVAEIKKKNPEQIGKCNYTHFL